MTETELNVTAGRSNQAHYRTAANMTGSSRHSEKTANNLTSVVSQLFTLKVFNATPV